MAAFKEAPMSQQNIDLVQSGYAAFGRGDIPGFLSLLDADVEWTTPAHPIRRQPARGAARPRSARSSEC